LTSLPNRNSLLKDLKDIKDPIIILIDIDSFRTINDLYGNEKGDTVLKEFAKVLEKISIKIDGKVYRTSSDEFVILRDVRFEYDKCKEILEKILKIVSQVQFPISKDLKISLDITMGVGYGKNNPLEKADMAFNKAYQKGAKYYIFREDEELQKECKNFIEIIKAVKEAINEDGITPFFQPIVDINKNIVYYEALIRIKKGDEFLTPNLFLQVAKNAKLYNNISLILIEKAVNFSKNSNKKISINLSYNDFENENSVNRIYKILKDAGIGKNIIFEITENETIKDFDNILNIIKKFKNLGSKIAIDDFGSGYSNFSYLLRMQPDFIKIDGSLIKEIINKKEAFYIVETIVEFAKKLGIKTIAEYVYCEEIYSRLKNIGVEKFQGYYFSEPKNLME